jgi:long-chain acyl-CoA synthetase
VAVVANVTAAPGIPDIFNAESSTLLFLPLAHSLARVIELSCVHARVRIGYTPDIKQLPEDLQSFRPTLILAVPRVFEKLYTSAQRKAHESGHATRVIFAAAEHVAIRYSEALQSGGPGRRLRLQHAVLDRLVYRKVRAALGGQVGWSVSGGAPLGARLGHFFRGVGVTVLEGYGLSESTTGGTLNLPARQKVGSVGPPIPGSTVHIAGDGEILLRGEFVFAGYWHNEVATKETIDEDGWLHTGDLGQVDEQGFITITGRKKELIVTSGGKNVAPAVLEDRLRAHWLVSQCMVVGDRRPYIGAVITLDAEMLREWLAEHGKQDVEGVPVGDPELVLELQLAVDAANEAVSKAESIRRFVLLDGDFTEAGGELTPTMKLKRDIVAARYLAEIESLYA